VIRVKSKIVLIASEISISANLRNISRKYQNSAATEKFHDSARNSTAHGKLWALPMFILSLAYFPVFPDYFHFARHFPDEFRIP